MSKTNESQTSTSTDPTLRTILDSIQKQQENIARLQEDMLRLSMQSDETNRCWVAEIGSLRRTVAELRLGSDPLRPMILVPSLLKATKVNRRRLIAPGVRLGHANRPG